METKPKLFYQAVNNGIAALLPARLYEEMMQRDHPTPVLIPIFTFRRKPLPDGVEDFTTGSYELMQRLIEGHRVEGASFYVPFSNGFEYSRMEDFNFEHSFRTTADQLVEEFGLIPAASVQHIPQGATRFII